MRWAIAITIWTGVSLALGGLFILAMRKIRGRDHWAMHMAQQEGFPEQAGPWPDPHQEPTGDFPNTKSIRAVGDRDNG
jgi:hypothetical protein